MSIRRMPPRLFACCIAAMATGGYLLGSGSQRPAAKAAKPATLPGPAVKTALGPSRPVAERADYQARRLLKMSRLSPDRDEDPAMKAETRRILDCLSTEELAAMYYHPDLSKKGSGPEQLRELVLMAWAAKDGRTAIETCARDPAAPWSNAAYAVWAAAEPREAILWLRNVEKEDGVTWGDGYPEQVLFNAAKEHRALVEEEIAIMPEMARGQLFQEASEALALDPELRPWLLEAMDRYGERRHMEHFLVRSWAEGRPQEAMAYIDSLGLTDEDERAGLDDSALLGHATIDPRGALAAWFARHGENSVPDSLIHVLIGWHADSPEDAKAWVDQLSVERREVILGIDADTLFEPDRPTGEE